MEPISIEDFVARMVIVFSLYGVLLVESNRGERKPKLWRLSVMLGMLGNGVSGFGYLLPAYIPNPDRIGLYVNAVFLFSAFISYVVALKETDAKSRRNAIFREMGFALALVIIAAVVVTNIRTNTQVENSNQDLRDELVALRQDFNTMNQREQKHGNRLDRLEQRSYQASAERIAILQSQGQLQIGIAGLQRDFSTLFDLLSPRRSRPTRQKAIPLPVAPIPTPKQLPTEKPGFFKRWFGGEDKKTSQASAPATDTLYARQ